MGSRSTYEENFGNHWKPPSGGGGTKINWPSVVIMAIIYLVTFAVQWGATNARLTEVERRQSYADSQNYIPGGKGVTKDQFDEFQADILRRLIRMEDKQDAQIRRDQRSQQ